MKNRGDQVRPDTAARLAHRVSLAQRVGRAPSLIGGIVRGGELAWSLGRGSIDGHPPDSDTQYRIGSLTKTFVAVLVLQLRDEGRINLTDRLERYLPGTTVDGVQLFELLAHRAGLPGETPPPWWERSDGALRPRIVDVVGADPFRFPPGHAFHYSNPGYALLGALIERLHGLPWFEVLQQRILGPLGMRRTSLAAQAPCAAGYAVHPWADVLLPEPAPSTGLMAPAAELWSTLADLARFADFLLGGHPDVLRAESLAELRRPTSAPLDQAGRVSYGLGMQLYRYGETTLAGHAGSMPGFLSVLWTDPQSELAAIALCNATSGPQLVSLAGELLALVAEHEPGLGPAWSPDGAISAALLELTGPWYWGATPFLVRVKSARCLDIAPIGPSGRASRFELDPSGRWRGLDGDYAGEALTVARDEAGEVAYLDIGSFALTRQPYAPGAFVPGGVDPAGWQPVRSAPADDGPGWAALNVKQS